MKAAIIGSIIGIVIGSFITWGSIEAPIERFILVQCWLAGGGLGQMIKQLMDY